MYSCRRTAGLCRSPPPGPSVTALAFPHAAAFTLRRVRGKTRAPGRTYTRPVTDTDPSTEVADFLGSVSALLDGSRRPGRPADPDADSAEDRTLTRLRARAARSRASDLGNRVDRLWERYEELRRAPSTQRATWQRAETELATGMAMALLGLSAQRARQLLDVLAWQRGVTVDELAHEAVSAGAEGDPGAFLRASAALGRQTPLAVRRAILFMERNARTTLTVDDVAAAAGTGTRTLQYAFRRYCGCTPLTYLRRIRLDGAHRELVAGDPTRGDTVAAVAERWGFVNHGRFSVEYRAEYGIKPSETLRA